MGSRLQAESLTARELSERPQAAVRQANKFLRAKLEASFLVPDDKRPGFPTQQNHCAVALPAGGANVFELPMGKILHVDAVYPPVAIARHTDDHEF
jgi:hypothetical protein